MKDYWAQLIGDAEKISIFTSPGMEYNEERCRNYVVNQAGNAVDACIKMYGAREFVNMINQRDTRRNPKYDMIVNEYRFRQLQEKVQNRFTVEDDPPLTYLGQLPSSIPADELLCDYGLLEEF